MKQDPLLKYLCLIILAGVVLAIVDPAKPPLPGPAAATEQAAGASSH